jgi:hypothetical protein
LDTTPDAAELPDLHGACYYKNMQAPLDGKRRGRRVTPDRKWIEDCSVFW